MKSCRRGWEKCLGLTKFIESTDMGLIHTGGDGVLSFLACLRNRQIVFNGYLTQISINFAPIFENFFAGRWQTWPLPAWTIRQRRWLPSWKGDLHLFLISIWSSPTSHIHLVTSISSSPRQVPLLRKGNLTSQLLVRVPDPLPQTGSPSDRGTCQESSPFSSMYSPHD